jgi:serine/threonine protein kinase
MVHMGATPYQQPGVNSTVNGKYVIERRLGAGGMAEVFLARTLGAEGFSRQVAIKRVLTGFSENPHFAQLFVSEAQLTSRLQHPNIVSVLDFDRDHEGRLFLVMELVDGADLDRLLATGPLPFPVILYITTEILHGLDYAHDLPIDGDQVRGIIHRDISPHNVLLSWNGAVKVSDFGIAKARAASNASASVMVKGKPAYMSPEQARGEPLDGRSDLFAVGVMLYEMICLQQLFAAETAAATVARLLAAEIPAPRAVRADVPDDLSRAVMLLLTRDRQKRFSTANAAISALVACKDYPRDGREGLVTTMSQRFVGRAPVRASSIPSQETHRPIVSLSPEARTITPLAALRLTSHRRRWPRALLAIFVLAIVAATAVIVTRRFSQSTMATPGAVEPRDPPMAAMPPSAMGSSAPATTAPISTSVVGAAAPGAVPATTPTLSGETTPRAAEASGTTPTAATPPATAKPPPPARSDDHTVRPRPQPHPKRPPAPSTDGIQEIQLGGK